MPAPIYVGPIVTPNNPPINFENILDYRAGIGGGGVYDSLMGGFVPDLNTVDIGVSGSIGTEEDAAAAQEAIIQDYVDSLLNNRLTPLKPLTPEQRAKVGEVIREGVRGFEFDPSKPKNASDQLWDYVFDLNKKMLEFEEQGLIGKESATDFLQSVYNEEGFTTKNGQPITLLPEYWGKGGDYTYGSRTSGDINSIEGGALILPPPIDSIAGGSKNTPSAADVLGGVGSVIGSILTGGSSGSSGSGNSGSNGSTAPSTPTAPATGGNTGATDGTNTAPVTPADTEHPWLFDGEKLTNVFTGEVITGGDFSTLEAGQRYSGAGSVGPTIKTPQEQWQNILNDPTMDVAGAVAAAELIFGNSPEGVAAVVDAANARGVSAEDVANNSNYSLSDIIAAANATGKVFTKETNTPATVVTPPTEVIPPAPPTPNPPTMPPAASTGPSGAEVAPPIIVPPTPPQEVIPAPPVVAPPPLQQPGFEGETGSETAPGSVDATDPDVTDPGDTGGGDDGTGDEGDGTGDGTGDGDGTGNGNGINIDLGGMFSGLSSPTPIVDDLFSIEKFKLNRPNLDITNTLFGGFRR